MGCFNDKNMRTSPKVLTDESDLWLCVRADYVYFGLTGLNQVDLLIRT